MPVLGNENFLARVECMTCCRPFTFALYTRIERIACPHCGAHYFPFGRGFEPAPASKPLPSANPH